MLANRNLSAVIAVAGRAAGAIRSPTERATAFGWTNPVLNRQRKGRPGKGTVGSQRERGLGSLLRDFSATLGARMADQLERNPVASVRFCYGCRKPRACGALHQPLTPTGGSMEHFINAGNIKNYRLLLLDPDVASDPIRRAMLERLLADELAKAPVPRLST